MARTRTAGAVTIAVAAGAIGVTLAATTSPSSASHWRHRPTTTTAGPATTAPPTTNLTAPTNLRVTGLTPTSVTFQWDHSQGATGGCTLPIFLYYVHQDGAYRGSTYLGSPVAFAAGLAPGGTYTFTVQGRDNCSGRTTPFSAPLIVTTPR
jgi:hypothetical protein